MKQILLIYYYILFSTLFLAAQPYRLRVDSLKVDQKIWIQGTERTSFFGFLNSQNQLTDDGLANIIIKTARDSSQIKQMDFDSLGSVVSMLGLNRSTNPTGGGGIYVLTDQAFPTMGGAVFSASTPGRYWVIQDFLINRIVTPDQFGAIPNDGNDDAAAINRAIGFIKAVNDSGGNCSIYPGNYTISSGPVVLSHRVNLIAFDGHQYRGSSTIAGEKLESVVFTGTSSLNDYLLTLDSDGPVWSSYTEQNSLIRGITFHSGNMSTIATSNGGLVYITDAIGFKIEDCHFYDSPKHGITLNHCIGWGITGGSALSNTLAGVQLQGASGDAYITNMQIGLNATGINGFSGYLVRIENNKIFNNSTSGLTVGGSPQNYIVNGNDFHDHETNYALNLSGPHFTVTSNSISKGNILLNMSNVDNSVISSNVFEDADYGIYDQSSLSEGNTISTNTFSGLTNYGITGLFSDKNTIIGNNGEQSRSDNYLTTYNISDSTLNLTQNVWLKIPLDTCNNRTSDLRLQGDSVEVRSRGLYEINGLFVLTSSAPMLIEIAPFIENTIQDVFVSSRNFTGSDTLPIPCVAYEYIADTAEVSWRIRNTTDNNDITVLKAVTSLKQMGLREPNYQYGAELITNGTFDSDITGWQNIDWSTFEWSSGALHLTWGGSGYNDGGIADASRFSVTSGKVYKFKFELTRNSGTSNLNIDFRFSIAGSAAKSWGEFSSGEYSFTYTATSTTSLNVYLYDNAAGDWTIDNISVREVINP